MPLVSRGFRLFAVFAFLIVAAPFSLATTERERDELRMLPEWFPYVSCQEDKMLRQCYRWTTAECEGTVENSSNSCLNQHRSEWMRPGNGTYDLWSRKIVDCVIRDIKAKLKGREVESILCQNKGVTR